MTQDARDGTVAVWALARALEQDLTAFGAVISIESPGQAEVLRAEDRGHAFVQLVLAFDDVAENEARAGGESGRRPPDASDVRRALDFARQHRRRDLMIHCKMGISRSTAVATAVLADRCGPGREKEAVGMVMGSVARYEPNRTVLALADLVLGRGGALVAAVTESQTRPSSEPVGDDPLVGSPAAAV